MKITIELTEKEVMELKDLIFGEEKCLTAEFDIDVYYQAAMYRMRQMAKDYGILTVADFKCIVWDGENTKYTDEKYGWLENELDDIRHYTIDDKHVLIMPKYHPL